MRKLAENHKSVTFFEVIGFIVVTVIASASITQGLRTDDWQFVVSFVALLVNVSFSLVFWFYTKPCDEKPS